MDYSSMILLTVPVYSDGTTTDEKLYVNSMEISEILPYSLASKRGDANIWNTLVVMTNGNQYKVLETPQRVVELIAAAE